MGKKKTHEEYVAQLTIKNPNVEVIEKYVNNKVNILHRCKIDNYEWKTSPNHILCGTGCPRCAGNAKKTHEEYVKEVAIINANIEVVDQYINAITPILHRCKIDGHEWKAVPNNVLKGSGCPKCANVLQKTTDDYIADLDRVNHDIIVIGQYINSKTAIMHHCNICGNDWNATPDNILSGKGCPRCYESSGERMVRQWLEANKITYITQKTFDNCKDKSLLPFDFYLPHYNMCIEYDGGQHFFAVELFGGEEELKKQQYHDEIKNQYCKNNNIHLLRIPYFKNVEEELNNFYLFNIVT